VVQNQSGQIVHETLSQKTLHKKWAGGMAQGEGPKYKPQYHKKEKRALFLFPKKKSQVQARQPSEGQEKTF
jgi:hypothetical protein